MRYELNRENYCTFEIFEKNKLPGRSYFIPYPDRKSADAVSPKQKRYASEKVICLNGEWDFQFYPYPADIPEIIDTDQIVFDKLEVPACWQFRGYDKPFYTNIRYQFPFDPPAIPTTEKVGKVFTWMGTDQGISLRYKDPGEEYNFVGLYRRMLEITDLQKRYVISFLGVASCLDLYLNGEFVGYSEGSHNTAEFDLTGKVKEGTNELVAVVHRWCNSTYLEDQDMFRNNGIFRDVLLRVSDPTDLLDIDVRSRKVGDVYELSVKAECYSDTKITLTLEGEGLQVSKTVQTKEGKAKAVFHNLSVKEWSADNPTLYNLYLETPTSCVKERIGFKTVRIEGDIFLVNGKAIKFHGVNHHDTSPKNGYTMTPDEIERDLRLCKEFNIDTVRTSHYPPDPLLLELADEFGIYIVDENDLETHGTWSHQIPPTYNTISDDPHWEKHYLDRITRLYQRDKIHRNTSIIMWSLGNEAGGYHNTDAMFHYLRKHTTIPVHYESAVHCKRIAYDVGSEMYPSVQMVHDVGEHCRKQKRMNNRPYFMCEYAHAMGVGPGNTEAYWKEIYQYPNLMGGCVWEMVDHAVWHEDGSYTYGGDHGEWSHDSNFCVDGMFYPDRTPSNGAKIIRFIYRPIRVSYTGNGNFELFNTTGFSDGSNYKVAFCWNDGSESVAFKVPGPLEHITLSMPMGQEKDGNLSAIVQVTDLRTGRLVSEEQLTIKQTLPTAPETRPLETVKAAEAGENAGATENAGTAENVGAVEIAEGKLTVSLGNGRTMTSADPSTILYRAATDNDTDPFFHNTMLPYLDQKEQLVSCKQTEKGYQVITKVSNKKNSFLVTDTYEGTSWEGKPAILVTSHLHCSSGKGIVPRFGKTYRLEADFDQVTYTGRTGESYCDMKEQFPIRTVSCSVSDMTEPNIRPQESGNRCDCTEAILSNGTNAHLNNAAASVRFIALDKPFELGIKPYTDLALAQMAHREDEITTGTYVTIQAFQQGIGTGACGPAIMPEYQYPAGQDYDLKFIIQVIA